MKHLYCTCGHALLQRDNVYICTICHAVYTEEDGKISFCGNTSGIRETREFLESIKQC